MKHRGACLRLATARQHHRQTRLCFDVVALSNYICIAFRQDKQSREADRGGFETSAGAVRGPGTSSVQRRVIAASSAAWPLRQLLQPALEISQLLRIRNGEAVKNKPTQLPSQMSPHGSIAARLGPDGSSAPALQVGKGPRLRGLGSMVFCSLLSSSTSQASGFSWLSEACAPTIRSFLEHRTS